MIKKQYCAILATLMLVGCSSAPKEQEVFSFESVPVQITVEAMLDGEKEVLFDKITQFVPNYTASNYTFSNSTSTDFMIPYSYKNGTGDNVCIEGKESSCHIYKFSTEEGLNLDLTYLGSDQMLYNIDLSTVIVNSENIGEIPQSFRTEMSGKVTLNNEEEVVFAESMSVFVDNNDEEHQYKLKATYKIID